MQIGDKFTNGKETATITAVSPNGKVKFQMNWQDKPCKYWTGETYIAKNYPQKVGA